MSFSSNNSEFINNLDQTYSSVQCTSTCTSGHISEPSIENYVKNKMASVHCNCISGVLVSVLALSGV